MSDGILRIRRGPGANCSSIGSAVEMLFLSATAGAALLVALNAALDEAAPPPDAPLPEPDPAESDSETPSPGADDAG